jgi:hypothetical protein
MWSHGSELRQMVSHPIHSFAELLCAPRRARLTRFLIVEVEGVVEYKSLPSGLHNVHEDLM